MPKTAIFAGSFDPFTIGHDDIVRRTLCFADRVVIGVGINKDKHYSQPTEERIKAIAAIYHNEPRVEVKGYDDLTIDLVHREGAQFIGKGVRNVKDFESEREQADINRLVGGVETVLLLARPELACVSSSTVRELARFGRDTSKFLPKTQTQ